jgi:hypothetical protein
MRTKEKNLMAFSAGLDFMLNYSCLCSLPRSDRRRRYRRFSRLNPEAKTNGDMIDAPSVLIGTRRFLLVTAAYAPCVGLSVEGLLRS